MSCGELQSEISNKSNFCVLCNYCYGNLGRDEQIEHNHIRSERHFLSTIIFLMDRRSDYQCAEIAQFALYSDDDGEPARTEEHRRLTNYAHCMEKITSLMTEIFSLSNAEESPLSRSFTTNSLTDFMNRSGQHSIQQLNNDSDRARDLQLQQYMNEMNMKDIDQFLCSVSDNGQGFDPTAEDPNITSPESVEHENMLLKLNSNLLHQFELDARPVSTDGILIWHIDGIRENINDAIYKRKLYIDSPNFHTSMYGHRMWARLFLNGNTDAKYLSIYIHLNFPVRGRFSGHIRFILVDQSGQMPLQHIIKDCEASGTDVNASFGFDEFADKNVLHKESSSYIRDDSIYFVVCIDQSPTERFANLDEHIQDAIMQSYGAN
ncbi:unnamed protein product [Adineta ricciae]|uniref:MATH domain-containing protein n=1 Tax=Adineta ricciae TaxID=249248 RepID=A0A813UQ11_ADIRI|nr:unnamed protein product [Adineta ricciae]CAF1072432.1 unnamed protein product [Adineta ricciae]